jgi:hypothetical protein
MSVVTHFVWRENAMRNPLNRIALHAVTLASAAQSHLNLKLAVWFSALVLVFVFGVQQMSATVTYYVGTCKSGAFKTIQSALNASPAPNVVNVCPGQYAEQLLITKPVTIEGITGSGGNRAQIVLPDDNTANATLNDGGGPIAAAAQILVTNVSGGAVNLTNLMVNGEGFGITDTLFIGIVYQNSSGTINEVITAFQNGEGATNVPGMGMWIQGGSSKPTVTVENSSIHDFNADGIFVTGTTTATDLTVTIKNNAVLTTSATSYDIAAEQGSDATVSGNVVNGGLLGILIDASAGAVSGNTVIGSNEGIVLATDGASIESNKIFDSIGDGIVVGSDLETSVVEDNVIRTVNQPGSLDVTGTGIELNCSNATSTLVHSNTITDALYGYGNAPAGFGGSNTYGGVVTEIGACTNASVANKANTRPKFPWQSH